MEILTCGLIIVFLLVVIIFLAMELVKAKTNERISNKERKDIAKHAWWNGRWYERGQKNKTAPQK